MKKSLVGCIALLFATMFFWVSCGDDSDKTVVGDTIISLSSPNLTAELTASSEIKLCWNYVTGADSYRLARFIDSDPDDRGSLFSSGIVPDGKGYTFTDASSLEDGVRYRYELTALTSNGYTEARTLYLKDSNTSSVTITYGNLSKAANLSNSLYPVSAKINGTAKATVTFYPNEKVEYRMALVESTISTSEAIIALKKGDTANTTPYTTSDVTYNGTESDTITISGTYKVDTPYYVVALARFKDTESFGSDWTYLGTPYGNPNDSLTMSEVTKDVNLATNATFSVRGTKKAEFTCYPLSQVEYRVAVAKPADSNYKKLINESITDDEITSLTTTSSKTASSSGKTSDTISISGTYEIGTAYYAFVFVKFSGQNSNYNTNWIRITSASTLTYFMSDTLTSTEVGDYAIVKNPTLSIINKDKAKVTIYPISTAQYQVGTASTDSGYVLNYTNVATSTGTTSSVSTTVSGSYSVTQTSSYTYYYARFRVKFVNDTYFGTSENWISVSTTADVRDYLSVDEFIAGSLTKDYISLSITDTTATATFPVDSKVIYRYAIIDTSDTTTLNTIQGAKGSTTYTAAEKATTQYKPSSSESQKTVTVKGTFDASKTYTIVFLALDSNYEKSSYWYTYYKVIQPEGVTAKIGASYTPNTDSGSTDNTLLPADYVATDGDGTTLTLHAAADNTFTMTATYKDESWTVSEGTFKITSGNPVNGTIEITITSDFNKDTQTLEKLSEPTTATVTIKDGQFTYNFNTGEKYTFVLKQ